MSINYGQYLRLEQVLGAVQPLTDARDEPLFIIAHQTAELWLKGVLQELDAVIGFLTGGNVLAATHGFARCREMVGVMTKHFAVLNTLTPAGFAAFRSALGTASGAGSVQFRQLFETLGGWKANEGRTVAAAFERFLTSESGTVGSPEEKVARLRQARPEVAALFERMIDFDGALQEWRFHHAVTAARLIGESPGTGGTSGAEYLRSTVFRPAFPVLWGAQAGLAG